MVTGLISVSSFLLYSLISYENPSNENVLQPNSCFYLTILCIVSFCFLNCKPAFLIFVLFFWPIAQFLPLYFVGPIVQIQRYGNYKYSKNNTNNNEDGAADSFIQSCPKTEDRIWEDLRSRESPHPKLPYPFFSFPLPSLPSILKFCILSHLDKPPPNR